MISTPEAPDPVETAAAQADLNLETATQQQLINMVDQVTPYGNLTYTNTGSNWYQDADGMWVEVPSFTATTTLSPEQQSILDETNAASLNLAKIANNQSAFLGDYLGKGIDTSGAPGLRTSSGMQTSLGPGYQTSVNLQKGLGPDYRTNVDLATSYAGANDFSKDRAMYTDALMQRMSPQQEQDQSKLRAQLINQGIRPGTAAWDAEWNRNQQGVNDARLAAILAGGDEQARMVGMARDAAQFGNDARLTGAQFGNTASMDAANFRNNALMSEAGFGNAALSNQFSLENAAALEDANFGNNARSQYLNEAYAERNQPLNEIAALLSGSQVTNPTFQSTPQSGVAGVDYTGLVNQQYQAELQSSQAAMGGLFGLLAAPFAMFSDIRLKEDIKPIGYTFGGTRIYSYRYKWGGPTQIGVMAQEVPEAAFEDPETGFLKVDYRKVH